MTTETKGEYLGEYGATAMPGHPVFDVYAVSGHVREVKRLWGELDRVAGSSDEPSVISRLVTLGAAILQS